MSGLNPGYQQGDLITVRKWLQRMGKVKVPGPKRKKNERNALTLVTKGQAIAAKIVDNKEESDTTVNVGETGICHLKRLELDDKVAFVTDRVLLFPRDFWEKAISKNLWLGAVKPVEENEEIEEF